MFSFTWRRKQSRTPKCSTTLNVRRWTKSKGRRSLQYVHFRFNNAANDTSSLDVPILKYTIGKEDIRKTRTRKVVRETVRRKLGVRREGGYREKWWSGGFHCTQWRGKRKHTFASEWKKIWLGVILGRKFKNVDGEMYIMRVRVQFDSRHGIWLYMCIYKICVYKWEMKKL